MTATIFALSSAAGRAGVSVIRISGSRAGEALRYLAGEVPQPRIATLRQLKGGQGNPIDHALLLWFPAPASFTGEDVAELQVHGSIAVIKEIISILSSMEGFRMAEPGEFSRRAFEHGKMDLAQAEGLADLIEAETEAQKRQALRQMEGELSRLYDGWREQLVTLLAHLEAYIDFPDEDLPPELAASLQAHTATLVKTLRTHLADQRGERLREGIYVAIVGAPNVGKSSLINALARRDVAIVSPEAGTTRDAIETHLNIGGFAVTLCDTAGLREGAGTIESEGIRRARLRAEQADIALYVIAPGQTPDPATLEITGGRALVVMNKADLLKPTEQHTPTAVSALTGQGIPELLNTLEQRSAALAGTSETPLLTRARHRVALTECVAALEHFLQEPSRAIELRAEDIRKAATSIGSITGRIRIDELMDKIFSSFCIGK